MKLYFIKIFEWIFPLSEDERLIISCPEETFTAKLNITSNQNIIALSSFKDPCIRAAIHLVKFHHHYKAINLLSLLLKKYFETLSHKKYLLIPVPLSSQRKRTRGYNQVEVVIKKAIVKDPRMDINVKILSKIRHTAPQTSLSKGERKQNLRDVFAITNGNYMNNKHIILIDDVTTTGTTLMQAKATIEPFKPASITCIAFAH